MTPISPSMDKCRYWYQKYLYYMDCVAHINASKKKQPTAELWQKADDALANYFASEHYLLKAMKRAR